jgi:hypothetical protein
VTIDELPFLERPARELLHLDGDRDEPDPTYAGYGWTRVPELWLDRKRYADVLVLAMHSADDSEPLTDDIELEFELPDGPVSVLASQFLDRWLPRLPRVRTIVLALCNPHHASLHTKLPVYYAKGNVESWLDPGERIRLQTSGEWSVS